MSVIGVWDLSVSTPVGKIKAVVELRHEQGVLSGTAHSGGEKVPLTEVALDGDRLAWKQAVTEPMRLNVTFDVTLDGHTMTGTCKAGRLPASRVTGRRRALTAGAAHPGE
ncbi:hypothetical protein ABZY93_29890 [Streptomyces smyrnaeus]|uniref:hypothetical protein n=1 Tax=Streptomyces smyrnaeus TaxID=1387713 RepID=UPI0033BB01B6